MFGIYSLIRIHWIDQCVFLGLLGSHKGCHQRKEFLILVSFLYVLHVIYTVHFSEREKKRYLLTINEIKRNIYKGPRMRMCNPSQDLQTWYWIYIYICECVCIYISRIYAKTRINDVLFPWHNVMLLLLLLLMYDWWW